ncbi:MAG: zinc-ribbon domain-containing protein [Candidatus Helarchaeota archaeon]
MSTCEFSESRSGGSYGYCTLIMTDVSSDWYLNLCTKTPQKCPYITVCSKCGAKNAASSTFCSECGVNLK